jgi:hypothetical protein
MVNTSFGQRVSATLTKEKIVIGEQTILEINVEGVTADMIQIDFVFPDTANHLEVLDHKREPGGHSVLIYTATITSFDSGYWELPPMEMILTDQRKLSTERIGLSVVPVDVSHLVDYHDIKDILELKPANNWWIIAAIMVLALTSLFGFLWFMNRKQPEIKQAIPVTAIPGLYNELVKKIRVWSTMDLGEKKVVMQVFEESTLSVRQFSDVAWQQNSRHFTTGEYILNAKGKMPDAELETRFFQYLRLADAVKFAKYLPPTGESKEIFPLLEQVAGELFNQAKSLR